MLCLAAGAYSGVVFLPPVDSGERGFRWSRLKLLAEIPREAAVQVYAAASDSEDWPEWRSMAEESEPEASPGARVRALFGPPAGAGTDLWLTHSGRYLWLALEMSAGGRGRPRIDGVSLRMGGDHMTDYLPAIYQEEDFTYRYLSIFDSMFQDMEEEIEGLPRQLKPDSASAEFLDCLAHWLCLEPEDGDQELRRRMPEALDAFENMYTVSGIRTTVKNLTGHQPIIIEHFSVDPNGQDCHNPELYRRLYGDNPYRFFLLLEQDAFRDQRQMERFLDRMRELIPAETELELVLLKPCIQLDWHTYLGINSRIGSYIPAAIDESVTIHYDTTIGGAEHE